MARQIEPELLQSLGLFVVRFAWVEQLVSDIFIHLTKGDPGAMVTVTGNVSQNAIVGWINTLLDLRYVPEEFEITHDLKQALIEVNRLRVERNALVHGLWGTDGPAKSACVMTVRLDRNPIIKDEVFTQADLDALIDDVLDVSAELRSIMQRAGIGP